MGSEMCIRDRSYFLTMLQKTSPFHEISGIKCICLSEEFAEISEIEDLANEKPLRSFDQSAICLPSCSIRQNGGFPRILTPSSQRSFSIFYRAILAKLSNNISWCLRFLLPCCLLTSVTVLRKLSNASREVADFPTLVSMYLIPGKSKDIEE